MRIAQPLAMAALAALLSSTVAMRAQEKKDYLSDVEADKIREATTPSAKMVLFVAFADDRIAKLKYTLAHPSHRPAACGTIERAD